MKSFATPLLLLLGLNLHAQWDTLGQFDYGISDLKVFDDNLFITGGFFDLDNQTCLWSAYYDGNDFTRHTNFMSSSGLYDMTIFNDDLYVTSGISFGFSIGIARWTGSTWEDGGGTSLGHSIIHADGDYLYACDQWGYLRRIDTNGISTSIYDWLGDGDVYSIMRYGNEMIFAGSFDSVNNASHNNIVAWDGSNWSALGGGLDDPVFTMVEYDGDLIVGGRFDNAGGNPAYTIAKWDGNSWSDLDGSADGSYSFSDVRDLKVYNDKLYVTGSFQMMGGDTAIDIAVWDGNSWSDLGHEGSGFAMTAVEVYDQYLYAGSFHFDTAYLFRYDMDLGPESGTGGGGTAVEEVASDDVAFFPNPTNDFVQIDTQEEIEQAQLFDISGKALPVSLIDSQLDLRMFQQGSYLLRVKLITGQTIRHTIIKQ